LNENLVQLVGIFLELRLCLKHHVILVYLRIHSVDLTLAESVIQRVING